MKRDVLEKILKKSDFKLLSKEDNDLYVREVHLHSDFREEVLVTVRLIKNDYVDDEIKTIFIESPLLGRIDLVDLVDLDIDLEALFALIVNFILVTNLRDLSNYTLSISDGNLHFIQKSNLILKYGVIGSIKVLRSYIDRYKFLKRSGKSARSVEKYIVELLHELYEFEYTSSSHGAYINNISFLAVSKGKKKLNGSIKIGPYYVKEYFQDYINKHGMDLTAFNDSTIRVI